MLIYPVSSTAAIQYAAGFLPRQIVTDHPSPEVTHILLDVPSFSVQGILRNGQALQPILDGLPEEIAVIGGNLADQTVSDYRCVDLLQDDLYLAQNAAITAECAMIAAGSRLTTTLRNAPVLVIGWGRIGKNLCRLLKSVGAEVVILIRREDERALAASLGYRVLAPRELQSTLPSFRLVVNTAPAPVITAEMTGLCKNCIMLDLASRPGILGQSVIRARGLPGAMAPESSGKLICDSILRLEGVKV